MNSNKDETLNHNVTVTVENGIVLDTLNDNWRFANIGYSVINTMVMLSGEIDYKDLFFSYWIGYVIFSLFVFLAIIGQLRSMGITPPPPSSFIYVTTLPIL